MVNDPVQRCGSNDAPKDTKKENWVSFKVVNKENGQPVAGVEVSVEMPNGDFCFAGTNEAGEVKMSDLDPGACKLQTDWRDLLSMGITVSQAVLLA